MASMMPMPGQVEAVMVWLLVGFPGFAFGL